MWRAVRQDAGYSRRWVVQHGQTLEVLKQRRRGRDYASRDRRWATMEAAQRVADKLNGDEPR